MVIVYLLYFGIFCYSVAELQWQFFCLGLFFDVYVNNDYIYLIISGLSEFMFEGIWFMEYVMANLQFDEQAFVNMKVDVFKWWEYVK